MAAHGGAGLIEGMRMMVVVVVGVLGWQTWLLATVVAVEYDVVPLLLERNRAGKAG